MWDLVVTTLYLFLPAYAANMTPVIAARWNVFPLLSRPLDGGARLAGQPLFGPHKTLRGIVIGVLAAIAVAGMQDLLADQSAFWQRRTLFPYGERSAVLWGLLLGGGALVGDLGKSFVKRRLGIPPGSRWFPWDQLDMAVGALLFGAVLFPFPLPVVLAVLILTPFVGLLVNVGGYMLKVKEAW
jgi:CDP-2,3-bis-(O-geranylgeranyl)-sn-glycerol synthase